MSVVYVSYTALFYGTKELCYHLFIWPSFYSVMDFIIIDSNFASFNDTSYDHW
jgi:hypothetical protein